MSGKILHIDFGDCFEVAMTRDKFPEKIPFRLTRMLINAMEVTGIEGTYRSTCESVMRVLRNNKDSLMAVLEAFVYDPLLNWRLMETGGAKSKKAKKEQPQPPAVAPAAPVAPLSLALPARLASGDLPGQGQGAAAQAAAAAAVAPAASAAAVAAGGGDSTNSTAANSTATESVAEQAKDGAAAANPAPNPAPPTAELENLLLLDANNQVNMYYNTSHH